jgi:CheY-like chemotaxis protein
MENLKLLIAEDNSFSRKFYDNYISGKVFDKRFAENGKVALEIYTEWRPDIILLDLMMPVMSGQEVLKEIRETRKDIAITIIISSLSSHPDDVGAPLRIDLERNLPVFGKPLVEDVAGYVVVVELPAETVVFRDQEFQIVHGRTPRFLIVMID